MLNLHTNQETNIVVTIRFWKQQVRIPPGSGHLVEAFAIFLGLFRYTVSGCKRFLSFIVPFIVSDSNAISSSTDAVLQSSVLLAQINS
jgi:hypothetical protein